MAKFTGLITQHRDILIFSTSLDTNSFIFFIAFLANEFDGALTGLTRIL